MKFWNRSLLDYSRSNTSFVQLTKRIVCRTSSVNLCHKRNVRVKQQQLWDLSQDWIYNQTICLYFFSRKWDATGRLTHFGCKIVKFALKLKLFWYSYHIIHYISTDCYPDSLGLSLKLDSLVVAGLSPLHSTVRLYVLTSLATEDHQIL